MGKTFNDQLKNSEGFLVVVNDHFDHSSHYKRFRY